jgi:hypothetical protein
MRRHDVGLAPVDLRVTCLVACRTTTLNQKGQAVQILVARLIVPRRQPGDTAARGGEA